MRTKSRVLTRRNAIVGLAAIGGGALFARETLLKAAATPPGGLLSGNACLLTPEAVEGPFYFDPKLVRADITEGKLGTPLKLTLQVVEAKDCAKRAGARVDIWHADALGAYSGYARQETGSTEGQKFLRGTQFTDADGQVSFATVYPGWYPGRTPHIHFKVFLDAARALTGQLYFPDEISDRIYVRAPYRDRQEARDTSNATDFIFKDEGGAQTLSSVAEKEGGFLASLLIGINRT
ncbi:MAG TPA: intradiol ring-cleavage dioxygenase [Methyloceanibacter sp.]|jgi:protocatechuate 3,4-dioxygenase beta subunit|nr:intradiol ring-cleavage dioxygenase [Methyloceanibacter sp.]